MRRQLIIFLVGLVLTGALSLVYQLRALAELTAFYRVPAEAVSTKLILSPADAGAVTATTGSNLEVKLVQAQQSINHRLEMLKPAGPYQVVVRTGYLEVTLPEHENTPYLVNVITSVGEISFIDAGDGTVLPLGERIQIGPYTRPTRHIYQAVFTGQEVEAITPPDSSKGEIFYRLVLKPAAAERFADFVRRQPEAYVCMVVDERVINCSKMYHQAGNTIDILPDLSSGTAVSLADLAIFLESGPLPMPLNVVAD
jgi:preprotein translocase subunit SecD